MFFGTRLFVTAVFVFLGMTFFVPMAVMVHEFRGLNWLALAAQSPHIFFFFPTFGLATLFAFYLPAAIFTDHMWRYVPFGRVRFIAGCVTLGLLSVFFANHYNSSDQRSLWEIRPEILATDRGDPRGCQGARSCVRLPYLEVISSLQVVSSSRTDLRPFVRPCIVDPFVPEDATALQRRFCFVTGALTTATECCRAQSSFSRSLAGLFADPQNRSRTQQLAELLLPFHIFSLLTVVTVGILLAAHRSTIDRHYYFYTARLERLILIGIASSLVWPIANGAYLLSRKALQSARHPNLFEGLLSYQSVLWAVWALALFFIFYRRVDRRHEAWRMALAIAFSVAFVLAYDRIVDLAVHSIGAGASGSSLLVFASMAVVMLGLSTQASLSTRHIAAFQPAPVASLRSQDIGNHIVAERHELAQQHTPPESVAVRERDRLFISYRRDDSSDVTARIYERLEQHFGEGFAFKDVDSIPLGTDFDVYIKERVDDCDVVLAVIGPRWLDIRDENGNRRLDSASDFVRLEIEAGLKRNTPLVPILVNGATMPKPEQLPESIRRLPFKHGIEIRRDPHFKDDVSRLIRGLARDERIAAWLSSRQRNMGQ